MSTYVMSACWPLQMSPTQKAVLISFADNANDEGYCWPSIPAICERTCLGRTAVIEAIRWLESQELVVADRSNGRHTRYVITPPGYVPPGTRKPVRHADGFAKRTGSPTGLHQSATRTAPVRQTDSNHQEPTRNVTTTTALPLTWDALPQLSDEQKVVVVEQMKGLPADYRQDVLDELAGALRAKVIKGQWPGWLHGVVQKAIKGGFKPNHALAVQAERKQRIEAQQRAVKQQAEAEERKRQNSDPAAQARRRARLAEIDAILRP